MYLVGSTSASFGAIPNSAQRKHARLMGIKADVDKLLEAAVPWDATDAPEIVNWKSYKPFLESEAARIGTIRKAGRLEQWWETAARIGKPVEKLFLATQGGKGSCAGCSMFERAYLTSLLKQIGMGAELKAERVNPIVTYAQTLGCNRDGEKIPNGQTIAAVLEAGAKIGTYPTKYVGEYNEWTTYRKEWEKYQEEAGKRQMGVCPLTDESGVSLQGDEMAEAVMLALKANKCVEFGNIVAVEPYMVTDNNNVNIPVLNNRWMHATIWSGYKKVNDQEYYRWENTHGYIYKNNDRSPNFGAWLTREQLIKMCSGAYCDAGIITYAEAPRGEKNLDLNPRG